MPLPLPKLDDRTFDELMDQARKQIALNAPEWTDLSPSDPGIVLLETFAHLTETMIYRLNRLPQKAYLAFLNLLGTSLHPPAAARVNLSFRLERAAEEPLEIPRGTRVAASRADSGNEAPVFVTARPAVIGPNETEVQVLAYHCDLIVGELVGLGTGLPAQSLAVRQPPIIAPTGDPLDLIVAVEATTEELDERAAAVQFGGKAYRVWREGPNFAATEPQDLIYVVDRMTGAITFAPALCRFDDEGALNLQALAAIPPDGREIRVWYGRGGGPGGNVAANLLTVLKDPIPGLEVTNPMPAVGGLDAESLDSAMIRGPLDLHSRQRAVTARDFESIARESSRAVARAKAVTGAELWKHAVPGNVEVLLVPNLPLTEDDSSGRSVSLETLRRHETPVTQTVVQKIIDERQPLGTDCIVNWARYKKVRVTANIGVGAEEDHSAVLTRVKNRLYNAVNPLPIKNYTSGNWPFGQSLRASTVYDTALAEPGVRWVDGVKLVVDDVPDRDVSVLAADFFQPQTWYAGSEGTLFRSLNDGESWEVIKDFPGETFVRVKPHPKRAGSLAALTRQAGGGSRLYISRDCGESWCQVWQFDDEILADLAWMIRYNGGEVVLLATDRKLYELKLEVESSPSLIKVDPAEPDKGFYAVVVAADNRGRMRIAVAAQKLGGVYLSRDEGESFELINFPTKDGALDIRHLAIQDGADAYLWAGAASSGGQDVGKGCLRLALDDENPKPEWRPFATGWNGGSCRGIAVLGNKVLAGTHRQGVVWLDTNRRDATWAAPKFDSGLRIRDTGRFQPISSVAAQAPTAQESQHGLIMAGGPAGIYSSRGTVDEDVGVTYQLASRKEFTEKVTLPATWLFVSADHEITVVPADEAS